MIGGLYSLSVLYYGRSTVRLAFFVFSPSISSAGPSMNSGCTQCFGKLSASAGSGTVGGVLRQAQQPLILGEKRKS